MKKMTKVLSLLLAAGMTLGMLAACADNGEQKEGEAVAAPTLTDEQIYDQIFGDFYTNYQAALASTDASERFALMAISEAKLLETGVFLPMQANGGNYAISKVAPYTITPVLWGNDSYRYHNALVCTTPIKTADRDALKALYAEKKGTGTWEESAKAYLTEHGYELQRTYSLGYNSNVETFDVFMTSQAADSEALVNTYDGLLEYDSENVLQPALATELPTVSEDGLTYTFKIREGVIWVDSTGAKVADLTADDFVAGFQHMLDDVDGGLSWLVDGRIAGVHDYIKPDGVSFDQVGVKAVDDYTVQYTLTAPIDYFDTMFGYGVFAPLSRSYYESLGGKFGFANGDAGTYGTDKDHIAYCGPYLITTYIADNSVVFEKNENYWNKDNINIDKITWVYNDGQIDTQAYDDFKAGTIDGCGLNAAALELAKGDGNFEQYGYVSGTDATSFPAFFNLHRRAFANFSDDTKIVSPRVSNTNEQARTAWAMLNHNFRLALTMSLDRGAYMEQTVGAELKLTSLVNSYTPGTFITLPTDVTVKINGTDKTYKAGTFYGQIMQDQIDADGFPAKVFDAAADGGIGSSGGYDGWYNPTKAAEYFAKAVEELKESGVEVSAENPIYLDLTHQSSTVSVARANVVKKSIEEALGGAVIINLIETTDQNDYLDATYYFGGGSEANYDINTNSGWGPDYGDPSTYLDTMVKGGGYMLRCMGLDA